MGIANGQRRIILLARKKQRTKPRVKMEVVKKLCIHSKIRLEEANKVRLALSTNSLVRTLCGIIIISNKGSKLRRHKWLNCSKKSLVTHTRIISFLLINSNSCNKFSKLAANKLNTGATPSHSQTNQQRRLRN